MNAKGGEYGNALQAALAEGNEVIVKLLLENGAEVNAEGGKYGNALQAASFNGNKAIHQEKSYCIILHQWTKWFTMDQKLRNGT